MNIGTDTEINKVGDMSSEPVLMRVETSATVTELAWNVIHCNNPLGIS